MFVALKILIVFFGQKPYQFLLAMARVTLEFFPSYLFQFLIAFPVFRTFNSKIGFKPFQFFDSINSPNPNMGNQFRHTVYLGNRSYECLFIFNWADFFSILSSYQVVPFCTSPNCPIKFPIIFLTILNDFQLFAINVFTICNHRHSAYLYLLFNWHPPGELTN